MRKKSITVTLDLDHIQSYTDEFLAQLWHAGQANPADFGDREACEIAEAIRAEIVRRWLKEAPVSLWDHHGRDVLANESMNARGAFRACRDAAINMQTESRDPVHQAACMVIADEIKALCPLAFAGQEEAEG